VAISATPAACRHSGASPEVGRRVGDAASSYLAGSVEEFAVSKSAIMVLLLLCPIAVALAAPAPPPEASATNEVSVYARREKLRVLHAQLVKIEDQIFADYNKFNTHHQYDIICEMYVRTDSHIRYRTCLPAFVHTAHEDASQDFMNQFHLDGHPAQPASMVVARQRQDFKRNYRKVISSHPELLELDRQYGELQKSFEALQRETFNGKLIDWN
jgi:hypothetical protein